MERSAPAADMGIEDLARIVWRAKLPILLLVVIAAGAAFGLDSRKTRLHSGSAQLLLTPQVSQVVTSTNGSNVALTATDVATDAKVISSTSNQQAAAAKLNLSTLPDASVSQSGTTNVVQITVTAPDAAFAARAANAYAQSYIDGQRTQAVDSLEAAAAQISTKINSLQSQITGFQMQINAANATAAANKATPNVASLQSQQSTLLTEQTTLQQQVTALEDNANLASGGGQIVSQATPNLSVVSPHTARDVALAAVIAVVLGLGLALLREFLDDRIRSEDDLEAVFGSVPPLGLIPTVGEWSDKDSNVPALLDGKDTSAAAEAYRSLRTSIQFLRLDRDMRTIVLTSPVANDGKTTTVANLALAMAQAEQRVIVVSCDLRKPELHRCFRMANEVGFTSVILGEATLSEALQDVDGVPRLKVLTAGPIPPNPSELLASERCERVLLSLAAAADIVLIDTPPVLPVTDAAILGTKADATLMVISASATTRKQATRALDTLSRVSVQPAGIVVNRVPHGRDSFYYTYGYGYTAGDILPEEAVAPEPATNGTSGATDVETAER